MDFLQAAVVESKVETYGKVGKFGASALLTPTIAPTAMGVFLTTLTSELENDEQFKLPRTIVLSDEDEIAQYDEKLIDELEAPVGTTDIATDTFDLFGVDFVFSSSGSFTLKCGHYKPLDLEQLTMRDVKEYITSRSIPRNKLLKLRIVYRRESGPEFSQTIKEALDFISDDDRVVLWW